jgi:hypothetical protein
MQPAQSFNGVVRQLEKCSKAHDTDRRTGCDNCGVQVKCLHIFDSFCTHLPEVPRFGGKKLCYHTSVKLNKLLQTPCNRSA